jgi:electron transfer flavoprotein beta subunit
MPLIQHLQDNEMRVVVCCKAVPKGTSNIKLNEAEGKIEYESDSLVMDESDACALEEALVLKKELGWEITVITVGSLKSQEILHIALAKGAGKAVRIDTDSTNSAIVPQVLAETIKQMEYNLILTGVESSDNMSAQTGVSIAGRLGLPSAFAVKKIEVGQVQGIVKATKELGQGLSEVLEITLPAVLCIESGVRPVSYPLFTKLMQARRTPVSSVTLESLGINGDAGTDNELKIIEVFEPPRVRNCEMIAGTPAEIAAVLKRKFDDVLR